MLVSAVSRVCAVFLILACFASAASPTSFCKCTCFGSYKIIPLDARADSSTPGQPDSQPKLLLDRSPSTPLLALRQESDSPDPSKDGGDGIPDNRKEYRQKNCNDCNRSFCLEQNLPECKDADENEVFATCFQRDSSKDEAVVFIFIFATVGLLGWALVKPCFDGFIRRRRERHEYIPVSDHQR